MYHSFCYYFSLFLICSFAGWCIETVACSIVQKKLVLNRGFLIGPYCPIYGFAAIFFLFFLKRYYEDPITLFLWSTLGASVIEYVTSYVMEKLFNARWWDYSTEKYNVNGRICFKNAIYFGLMGMFFIYIVDPFLEGLLGQIPYLTLEIVASILFIIFIVDTIISFHVISRLKISTKLLQDSSEMISEQVKKELRKEGVLKRRLLNAFPDMKTHYGDAIIDTLRNILGSMERGIKTGKRKLEKQARKVIGKGEK